MSRKYALMNLSRDLSEPDVIEGAQECGWEVFQRIPVDLLLVKAVPPDQLLKILKRTSDGKFIVWVPLECKTAQKNGRIKERKDRKEQTKLCERLQIDRATSKVEAKLMLGEQVTA